jgi:hypothetical protein
VVASPNQRKIPKNKKSGGHVMRHTWALMGKNWMNWKRTWCASCCEILCPAYFMFLLVLIRLIPGLTVSTDAKNPVKMQFPVYSPAVDYGQG